MIPTSFYHLYNRGNNRENIFFKRENYLFFLRKTKKHLLPHLDILAWCLMPNHFHFMVYAKPNIIPERCSNDLRVMLRSYTRAINIQENRTGSLFQQNTKVKPLDDEDSHGMTTNPLKDYPFICFHYLHQNPMKAGLVKRMEDWEMSSFKEYAQPDNNSLCNKTLAYQLLEIPENADQFIRQSYTVQIINPKDKVIGVMA